MFRSAIVAGAGAGVLAAVALTAGPAGAASGWSVMPIPPAGQNAYTLGVHAHSDSDAWAVGSVPSASTGTGVRPLIDHWDGAAWKQVATPGFPSGDRVHLTAVDASSGTDAWAVGYTQFSRYTFTPLTLHWDGTSWTTSTSEPLPTGTTLGGVADLGPSNAWAIGNNASYPFGMLEHWDGTAWTRITYPDPNPAQPGMDTTLDSISARSATDIWAVGTYLLQTGPNTIRKENFSLHWNGSTWGVVPMPLVAGTDAQSEDIFDGLDAIAANDVWAVGRRGDAGGSTSATIIEHWNGTAWSIVPSPSPGSLSRLSGVSARSASDVWAVGSSAAGTGRQTLTLHWDGTAWTTVPSPNVGASSILTAVSTSPGASLVFAIGYSGTTGTLNPLSLTHP